MTTATITQQPDLETLAADAERHLEELRAARQRLSLDALSDPVGAEAQELRGVEDEIASAERVLEQARLAGGERLRRDAEARDQAEGKLREQAERRVQRLRADVPKLEEKVDAAMRSLGEAMAEYCVLLERISGELRASGERGEPLQPWILTGALAYHLGETNTRDLLDLGPVAGTARPLTYISRTGDEHDGNDDDGR